MINKQLNKITELSNLVKSLISKLPILKTLVPNVTELDNKFSSIQESDKDNRLSKNNSAPSVVVLSEQPSKTKACKCSTAQLYSHKVMKRNFK